MLLLFQFKTMSSLVSILITLIRHGETEYNVKHITQGQLDVPLNEKGKHQAILAGESLKNDHFDLIYSSDLSRAFETAKTIVKENLVIKKETQIVPEELLRETCHGIFENRPSLELKEAAKAAGFEEPNLRKFRPPGGENQDDLSFRASQFLTMLLAGECMQHKEGDSILIVSHGLFIRELLRILLNKETSGEESVQRLKNMLISGTGPNTGISKFYLSINANCDLISTKHLLFLSDSHLNTSSSKSRRLSGEEL